MAKFKSLKDLPVKSRLAILNKKQNELIKPLREKGLVIDTARLSLALNGFLATPSGDKIIQAVKEILEKWEAEK